MRLRVETAAHVAGEAEVFAVIETKQERAERETRGAGGGPACNDGVEGVRGFQLQPVGAAIADVTGIEALGYDSFQTAFPG